MTGTTRENDPFLERAREEAEGTELIGESASARSLEKAREEAQGVEVFEDPDATLRSDALREGSPGHETLTDEALRNDDEEDWGDVDDD